MRSFSTDELLDSLPDVVEVLRNPYSHRGEMRPHLVDLADGEFCALWRCCLLVDLDPTGIPAWVSGGRLRGLSLRTTAQHLSWMISDLADRLPLDDSDIHRELWVARLSSIGGSRDAASIMQEVIDAREEDAFAAWRAEDGGSASVA